MTSVYAELLREVEHGGQTGKRLLPDGGSGGTSSCGVRSPTDRITIRILHPGSEAPSWSGYSRKHYLQHSYGYVVFGAPRCVEILVPTVPKGT